MATKNKKVKKVVKASQPGPTMIVKPMGEPEKVIFGETGRTFKDFPSTGGGSDLVKKHNSLAEDFEAFKTSVTWTLVLMFFWLLYVTIH